jgi:hypothetical protein
MSQPSVNKPFNPNESKIARNYIAKIGKRYGQFARVLTFFS